MENIEYFDEEIINIFYKHSDIQLTCFNSIMGGIVAQEVIKVTGKYPPINQILFFDFLDIAKKLKNNNLNVQIDRYYGLKTIFGEEKINKLQSKNFLLVGTGALGCELLKIFALLGFKNVTAADDDLIELSNLNRQFLFHRENIGKSKVEVSCKAALKMNKDLTNYKPIIGKISFDEKTKFDKNFWKNQDILICAIDSLKGRLDLDNICTLFEIPLLNGGTNGCSGRADMYLPFKTGCFNDFYKNYNENLESNNGVVDCTLRHFPSKIEDCIRWSREIVFEENFVEPMKMLKNIISTNNVEKTKYIENLRNNMKMNLNYNNNGSIDNVNNDENLNEKIVLLLSYLELVEKENNSIEELIIFGIRLFNLLFIQKINEFLALNPLDKKNSDSTLFWSGQKRPPHPLVFDIQNNLCIQFISDYIFILNQILNLKINEIQEKEINSIKNTIDIHIQKKIKSIKITDSNKNNLVPKDNLLETLLQKIMKLSSNNLLKNIFTSFTFEKDKPELCHVNFIHTLTALRAENYNIPMCDKYKTFKICGNIGAQTISSTAYVSGFIGLQLLLLATEDQKLYRNTDFDLVDNVYAIKTLSKPVLRKDCENDPIFKCPTKMIPKEFNCWEKLIINKSKTLKKLIELFKLDYNVDVSLVKVEKEIIYKRKKIERKNDSLLHKNHRVDNEKLLKMKIEKIYQNKIKSKKKEEYLFIEISGTTIINKKQIRAIIPLIIYYYK